MSSFLYRKHVACLLAAALVGYTTAGCTVQEAAPEKTIEIDGSSTVAPISKAAAEEFQKQHGVTVVVGVSGTGGGFDRFVRGETIINDASRPIGEDEKARAAENGIEFVELPVAIDGLSVVVNPENAWCEALSVEDLRKIWEPNSRVETWSDIDPEWPEETVRLYGPDTASGTFDYFTEVICGEEGRSRSDYTASTDDNVLVTGVANEQYGLGYFGYAYYIENKDKLKVVAVAPGSDRSQAVLPSVETIESGEYRPLSRPLFLYVRKSALERPEVVDFLRYYLDEGQTLVREEGYVQLSARSLRETKQRLDDAIAEVQGDAESASGE